jgi:glycosyltransferase involved in cell wall biosynthesis
VIVNKDERQLSDTLDAVEHYLGGWLHEVLVVDASRGALDDIRLSHEWARWIDYTQPPGVRISIAQQRNVGVRQAEGDVIVFTDSGCIPGENWLENLLTPILDHDEVVCCGPASSFGESIYSEDRRPMIVDTEYVRFATTINLAFRREAFDAVNGFDETFGTAEDIDFTWRLSDHGYQLKWVHDAIVAHDWGSPQRQLRRAFFYGKGETRLLRKHPQRLVEAIKRNPTPVIYALFLAGLPLTAKWRWYPLLLLWPIWRHRNEKLAWLVVLDHLAMGAGAIHELLRPRT